MPNKIYVTLSTLIHQYEYIFNLDTSVYLFDILEIDLPLSTFVLKVVFPYNDLFSYSIQFIV